MGEGEVGQEAEDRGGGEGSRGGGRGKAGGLVSLGHGNVLGQDEAGKKEGWQFQNFHAIRSIPPAEDSHPGPIFSKTHPANSTCADPILCPRVSAPPHTRRQRVFRERANSLKRAQRAAE